MYTAKYWRNRGHFDEGEAMHFNYTFEKDIDILISDLDNLRLLGCIYAFEVYETVSGETYFHSEG